MTTILAILARAPVAGQVKTRLIPALGEAGAARAHERLVRHVMGSARQWQQRAPALRRIQLWCTPDPNHPLFRELAEPGERHLQPPGDLGRKMALIARNALSQTDGVILLGADAGSLTPTLLEEATRDLLTFSATMAPTRDGGFILLGLNRFSPHLFQGIPWGTSQVSRYTRERLEVLSWPWHALEMQWDVDTPADWERFVAIRAKEPPPSPG